MVEIEYRLDLFLNQLLLIPGVWTVNNVPAGFVRTAGQLQYLVVSNSGHMVPLSKPAEAYDMMEKFINKKTFAIPLGRATITSTMPPADLITDDAPRGPREKLLLRRRQLINSTGDEERGRKRANLCSNSVCQGKFSMDINSVLIPNESVTFSSNFYQVDLKYQEYFLKFLEMELLSHLNTFYQLPSLVLQPSELLLRFISRSISPGHISQLRASFILTASLQEFHQLVSDLKTSSFLSVEGISHSLIVSKIDPSSVLIE
jgi:hypothetical protein